jgi:signal transduction histidine kinase/DNA-binding response OmpR family regulator
MYRIVRYFFTCSFLGCSFFLTAQLPDSARLNPQIRALYESGKTYLGSENADSAGIQFQKGLELARRAKEPFLTATGLYHQSRFYEAKHEISIALEMLQEAVTIFKELGLQKNVANCYSSFNRIYQVLGNYSKALDYGLQALRIKEQLNDRTGIAVALTNVGNIYLQTNRYDEAIFNFTKAYSIDSTNKDQEGISISLLNIGVAHQKKGAYDKALSKYREALVIIRQLGNKEDEAWTLGNMGSTFRQQGRYDSALAKLVPAMAIMQEIGGSPAHTINDIAETYLELKNAEQAEKYALLAIDAAKKQQNLNQLRYAWLYLGQAHELSGDFKNAFAAFKQHAVYKDSLLNIEKEKQMNELQVQYESEKKEQTIGLLTREKEAVTFRRNTYLIVGLLVATILLLLYNWQRLRTKKNRQMYEQGLEVEKMKSAFFSNISHEFRTPLTLILGPTQSLRSGIDDPKMLNQLNTMEKNARRLLSLIDQLLDLSKLESGKLTAIYSQLDIVPIVRGVTMTFSSVAASRQIELTVTSTTARLDIYADREKLETILINLLSNAFKFTPDQGRIQVNLHVTEKNEIEYCRISVQDSGIGIPEKDIPHIFDRFYQSKEGQKAHYGGSGIGLALAKDLVLLHKGEIDVSSKPNEGTTVVFLLPFGKEHAGEQEIMPDETGPLAAATISTTPIPVADPEEVTETGPVLLLIEDNEDVMFYLKDILQDTYTILEARDGEAGIALAVETIPDLVISDVMMPGKDGYQVCETLKQDERTSHIPLILLTARASFEDKMQGLQNKADEYLTKPFSPGELLLRVSNLIDSRAALREKYSKELVLQPTGITVTSMEEAFLQKVMKAVEEKLSDEGFSIVQLAREVGMSRSQLHRKLHALTNQSATEFIRTYRMTRAMDMIKQNAGSISEIAYWTGFSSPSYFSKVFLQQYGITPGQAKANRS